MKPREEPTLQPVLVVGRADGGMVCMIMDLPGEPGEVGIMLADIIRNYGNAYCGEAESVEKAKVVLQIWEIFQAEMSNPTDKIEVLSGLDREH